MADKVRKFALLRGAESFPHYGGKHTSFGLNYRFGSLLSAVALAQLEILPQQNRRRVELAQMLDEKLVDMDGVIPIYVPPGCSHLYWLYALQLDLSRFKAGIWEISDALKAEGIPCSPAPYYLLPDCVTFLSEKYGIKYGAHLVPKAKAHLDRTIRWPWTDKYTEKDINDIARAIGKVLNYYHI
ncbi:MAG: DegT/DnrJ/EryC1/StrS family aminotransferase [Candidatus Bathyarchaeia archaeon]